MTLAYIALGGNIGDRLAAIGMAVAAIGDLPGTRVTAASRVYETEPWGVAGQEPYANAVVEVETTLRADDLLVGLQEIETALGRHREQRYGPRVIDLDILLYGDEEWCAEGLIVPHPLMAERDFVITPLLEVAPLARYPDGSRVSRDDVRVGRVTGVLGAVDVPGQDADDAEERADRMLTETAEERVRSAGEYDDSDWDDAYGWSGESAEWVSVASGWGARKDAEIALSTLLDAGIPATFDRVPFTSMIEMPLGAFSPTRILVPPSRAEEARAVLRSHPAVDRLEDACAAREIAQAREEPTFWARAVGIGVTILALLFLLRLLLGSGI